MSKPRVIKLGGSLLELDSLRDRLRAWLRANPAPQNLIVVGGGQIVEAVRGLDKLYALEPSFVHWLCIDLLESTARVIAQLFPEFRLISSRAELQDFVANPCRESPNLTAIVAVRAFYDRVDSDPRLPEDWRTTSDSLAALLATQLTASELVLLKSTKVPTQPGDLRKLAEAGVVDVAFPTLAGQISKISLVNLR